MKKVLVFLAALMLGVSASADEGMWLLPMLRQMVGKDLKAAGCKLSPEDIYSINKSSLKDAIVQFGGGCTGEMISDEGLLVTNHHCGYSTIQGLSTDESNYLMNGYWAKSRDEELPCPGLTVTFLVSMEDVTEVLSHADNPAERGDALVEAVLESHPGCTAEITSFYNQNIFYLIVYKTYTDVRFVGAPPATLGKFGGETDNWMWPRHTCDFSMFRIYAGQDNQPADYSPENVPYKPARSLKVSLKGVKENDFAMVMGYPGRTQRYQTAAELEHMIKNNRIKIDARTVRQEVMWDAMCEDPSTQLKYADKYASSANGWKKWQGEELAFENLNIIGREKEKEEALKAWIEADPARKEMYGDPIADIEERINSTELSELAVTLISEAPYRIELVTNFVRTLGGFNDYINEGLDSTQALARVRADMKDVYRDYVEALDRKEAVVLLEHYRNNAREEDYLGEDFRNLNIPAYVDTLFGGSLFTSYDKFVLASYEDFLSDPAAELYKNIVAVVFKHYDVLYGDDDAVARNKAARKHFAAALMEWEKGSAMYPDANFTMRLTYGHVLPYSPKDGLKYLHFTTAKGLLEKEDPNNPEFILPAGVKDLLVKGDYGRWADADGTLHTCFLTNNDITGGNSGSPVLDAKGNLIGLAFDGNWESMSSDVMFEPELQRCICVDIRYVLWLVEKFGGATNIIDEITFVK
ncbi:MAG: S46 family peptidase [Bacteroidales bacterium]|nr:S46 family peptidase [Bacteroidales bacterium]